MSYCCYAVEELVLIEIVVFVANQLSNCTNLLDNGRRCDFQFLDQTFFRSELSASPPASLTGAYDDIVEERE